MHCTEDFTKEEIEQAIKAGKLLSLEIEFNKVCNFSCTYCYKETDKAEDLSKAEFITLLCQAHTLGVKKLVVLGGEPTLYHHLIEMLSYADYLGMSLEIFTNGANLDLQMAQAFKRLNVNVIVKMNSFSEGVQNALAGNRHAFRQIDKALHNLKAVGCKTGISSIICAQNIRELPEMWRWAKAQGITPYFEIHTPQGNAKDMYVDMQEVKDLFHKLVDNPQPPLIGGVCLRHKYSCLVTSTGEVQACVGITQSLGNVKERSLADIVANSKVLADLKAHKIHGPCSTCDKSEECYGCRGTAYQLTGDYLASDPMCWRNS